MASSRTRAHIGASVLGWPLEALNSPAMNLRLNPLYKKWLMLAIVIGPIYWLMFTDDGQRRTDLAMLHLFGEGAEINLAIDKLYSGMTETRFRDLFPALELVCDDGANPFGDRLCTAEVDAFSGIPSRAFTLFLNGNGLQAAKLNYRRSHHETLKRDLTRRLGTPIPRPPQGPATVEGPLSWLVSDGLLLLPPEEPESDRDAALMWLSKAAIQRRVESGDGRR